MEEVKQVLPVHKHLEPLVPAADRHLRDGAENPSESAPEDESKTGRMAASLTSKYCPSVKGFMLSSLSSLPHFPPVLVFRTTTPSFTLGFMWKAMSWDLLTVKLKPILER